MKYRLALVFTLAAAVTEAAAFGPWLEISPRGITAPPGSGIFNISCSGNAEMKQQGTAVPYWHFTLPQGSGASAKIVTKEKYNGRDSFACTFLFRISGADGMIFAGQGTWGANSNGVSASIRYSREKYHLHGCCIFKLKDTEKCKQFYRQSNVEFKQEKWYHAAVVCSRGRTDLYQDGTLIYSYDVSAHLHDLLLTGNDFFLQLRNAGKENKSVTVDIACCRFYRDIPGIEEIRSEAEKGLELLEKNQLQEK